MEKPTIRLYPNAILLHPCTPVVLTTGLESVCSLLKNMKLVATETKAVGLAANQIGDTRRILIYQASDGVLLGLVNPVITAHSEENEIMMEGCLSLPHIQVPVPRYKEIAITAFGEDDDPEVKFSPFSYTYVGPQARYIQHEIDHLNGVLIVDYMKKLDRMLILSKWQKRMKQLQRRTWDNRS